MFHLPNINVDWFSFFLGIAAATLIWWISLGFRRIVRQARQTRKTLQEAESKTSVLSIKTKYNELLLLWAQHQHLTDSLFPLHDLLIEPKFIPPPPSVDPEKSILIERLIDKTLPFNPISLDVISQYPIKKITLLEAGQNGRDLAFIGGMGSGKTTALITFLLKMITGKFSNPQLVNRIPIFAHVQDLLNSELNENSPLEPTIQKIAAMFPRKNLEEAREFLFSQISETRFVLLLDGLDELSVIGFSNSIKLISILKQKYPDLIIVTTIRPDQTYDLFHLGFSPLFIASWDQTEQKNFVSKWQKNWKLVEGIKEDKIVTSEIQPEILSNWLLRTRQIHSPLEWTLLLWGMNANDIRTEKLYDLLDAFVLRKLPDTQWIPALAASAVAIIQRGDITLSSNLKDNLNNAGISTDLLLKSKLFLPSSISQLRFVHPAILSYFVSNGNKQFRESATNPNDVFFYAQYMWFSSSQREIYDQMLISALSKENDPISLIPVFEKLQFREQSQPFDEDTLASVLSILDTTSFPLSFRFGFLSTLFLALQQDLVPFTNKFLSSTTDDVRIMLALLIGTKSDKSMEKKLIEMLSDPVLDVQGAACFALIRLNTANSLQTIVELLLEGEGQIQKYAAEALASDSVQGFDILKQTVHTQSISTRRASVQAIATIAEDWVNELLTQISVEDDQWIIRDMAAQMLEYRQKQDVYIPHRVPAAADASWLLQYASSKGLSISRSELPFDLLFDALKLGTLEEQLATMDYLNDTSREDVREQLVKKFIGPENLAREKAAFILWMNSQKQLSLPQ